MELNRVLARADERAQCAALRRAVLTYGHHLGWSRHAAIAFAEGSARRPWKRCTRDQLVAVVGQLRDLHHAFEVRCLVASIIRGGLRRAEGDVRAPRR
jgi:hypothetical protein